MKFYLVLDENSEPSVTVKCKSVTPTVVKIEELCSLEKDESELLYGYRDNEITPLDYAEVVCFFTRDGKVFAMVGENEYATKLRIKQVLELTDDTFIRINQGCVINIKKLEKFKASFGGALMVIMKNGYSDYVARRELKNIKRRLGL